VKNIFNNRLHKHFLYILPLLMLIGSINGMKRLLEKQTKITSFMPKEKKAPRFEKWQNIWIKTSDNQLIAMPEWQVDQVKVLQMLLINQKGKNRKDNPIDASDLRKNNGKIVNTSSNSFNLIKAALETSKNPQELQTFMVSLLHSPQKEDQKNGTTLINTAFDLEANALSAALASAVLPSEIQSTIGVSLLSPVITYFIENLADTFVYPEQWKKAGIVPFDNELTIISPNGQYALSNDQYDERKSLLWNLNTKQMILRIHNNIKYVTFSFAGNFIISKALNAYQIFNYLHGTHLNIIHCNCIALSPNDKHCLYNNFNQPGIINLFQYNDAQQAWDTTNVSTLTNGHTAQVNTIEFSPDGNYIVSGSNDDFPNNLILWDAKTFQKITSFSYKGPWTTHIHPVIQADFTPDSKHIISKDRQKNVIVWDVATQKPIVKLDVHNKALWDIARAKPVMKSELSEFTYYPYLLHSYQQTSSTIVSDEMILYEDKVNKIFDHSILPININAISRLSKEHNKIIGQKYSQTLLSKNKIIIETNNNNKLIFAFESSDSQYLILGYFPESTILRFSDTGKTLNIPSRHTDIRFSPQNDRIIVGHYADDDRMFSIWNIADLKMMRDVCDTFITLAQAHFLYRLYLAKKNNVKVVIDQDDPDYTAYTSLPANIKNLVDRFLPVGIASDIFQKALQEFRK